MKFISGLPETACGAGSTLAFTAHLRAALPDLLRDLKIRSLVDAPCGDLNWVSQMDLACLEYIGIDNDRENLGAAYPKVVRARSRILTEGDILANKLPTADAWLCRDFLQHLPNATALKLLRREAGNYRWFLLTSHEGNAVNTDIEEVGGFRPLDLMLPPFSLPPPLHAIPDGTGRIFGIWPRAALAHL